MSGGGTGVIAVDAQLSRAWRWQACGAIPPTPANAPNAVQASYPPGADTLAVLYDDGSVVFYPNKDDTAPRTLRLAGPPPATIAFSQDASRLVGLAVGGSVRVTDVATGSGLDMEANASCAGTQVRFSAEGEYVLAWSRTSLCVWQARDGVLVTQLAGDFLSAAVTNGRILTAEGGVQPNVKSWSLSGRDDLPVNLDPFPENLPPVNPYYGLLSVEISPRGDSFAATNTSDGLSRLWSKSGKLVVSWRSTSEPLYSASGALVLFGNEVFNVTSQAHWTNTAIDNAGVSSIDETGLWIGGFGLLAMRAESGNPGARRVFGSLDSPSAARSSLPTALSFSPDGTRLAASTIRGALLWRVASEFSASVPLRSMDVGLPMEAAFSSTSGEVVVSGDGGAIYSSGDGAVRDYLPLPVEVPTVDCGFGLASISPTGRWVTVGGTRATVTVFARPGLQSVIALPTARCQERGRFNADETLLALPGPELYRTSDWSLIWPAQIVSAPPADSSDTDLFRDVQFAPGEKTLLVSHCAQSAIASMGCTHALYAASDGALIQSLPALTATRARFSAEGNWIVSGSTALHLPTNESVTFDPAATLSTFAPNGDIVAILNDNTIARYCRTP